MLPLLRSGDILTIAPLRGGVRLGDVVAFVGGPDRGLVVHRVCGRYAGRLDIRADNARDPADIVPVGAVLGVVTRAERGGRRVRLGLGPERVLVAVLVRLELLQPLTAALRALRRSFVHRSALS